MAIISANRYSTVNGRYVITANENYGMGDIGQIMIEDAQNDLAIFNAALRADLNEIRIRSEGTLLESEIQQLNEGAIKDFFKALIEKLKKFWAKMKSVFKQAYAMITTYVVRNGKAFVAANRKALYALTGKEEIKGEIWCPKGDIEPDILKKQPDTNGDFSGKSSAEITEAIIKTALPGYDSGSVYDYMKELCFEKKTNPVLESICSPREGINFLENSGKLISKLKESERKLEKSVKDEMKKLENQAKTAVNNEKDEKKKAELEEKYQDAKNATTGVTNAVSTLGRSAIKLTKFCVTVVRTALGRAIVTSAKIESTLAESMILEAEEEIGEMDDEDTTNLSPEEAEEVAEILTKAAEQLSDDAE